MRCAAAALSVVALILATPALAQVNSRPTDRPIVTAENESWYRQREPIVFAGDFYYPAGAVEFFNGSVMVRTGHYNGIPLYADTTIEPYSVILVPIGRGLMQPYERLRDGELAGTSGSRAPSFPGRSPGVTGYMLPGAAGSPTNAPLPIGAIGVYTPETGAVATAGTGDGVRGDLTPAIERRRAGKPFRYDAISFRFNGEKWVMAGPSVERLPDGLTEVAEYRGFPVFAARGQERARVYLPITPDRFAPFEPAER